MTGRWTGDGGIVYFGAFARCQGAPKSKQWTSTFGGAVPRPDVLPLENGPGRQLYSTLQDVVINTN